MEKQPSSRMCFLCGVQNPIGLKMDVYNDLDNNQVVAEFTLTENYQGYPDVAHGGIIATILDEVTGRATLLSGDPSDLMITANIKIKYRKPTPLNTPLKVVAHLTRPGKNRARAHGEIRLPDGTVSAEAEVPLTRPPKECWERWVEEQPFWKVYP